MQSGYRVLKNFNGDFNLVQFLSVNEFYKFKYQTNALRIII